MFHIDSLSIQTPAATSQNPLGLSTEKGSVVS